MERLGSYGVSFLVSIILARLLEPEHHGVIALVNVFTALLQVFVDSGLGTALVQKKNADTVDFSTVFFFNMGMCTTLYCLMFFAAPWIARFYEIPELTPIVRVQSLVLVFYGVRNVQNAFVAKNMLFKKTFMVTLSGSIVSAVVGITMAYLDFGIWALVGQTLTNQMVATIVLWWTVKWRPTWQFSFQRLKGLFSYGWKLLVSALLDTVYNDLRTLIIGKKYSSADLAFYEKGSQFPKVIVSNINTAIDSVLLPAMSREQDDRERVRAMTRRAIRVSSFCMWPMMVGLAVCGESLIRLVLTEKWLPSLPFLYVFCFSYAFQPIHTANLNAIKAMGRSDLFLKMEIVKKVIGISAILISMQYGVLWMAYSLVITSVINQFVNSYPNRKLLGYKYEEQLRDILPTILIAVVMGAVVYCVKFLGLSDFWTLCIQVSVGACVYVGISWLLRIDSFLYILNILKGILHKKNR